MGDLDVKVCAVLVVNLEYVFENKMAYLNSYCAVDVQLSFMEVRSKVGLPFLRPCVGCFLPSLFANYPGCPVPLERWVLDGPNSS